MRGGGVLFYISRHIVIVYIYPLQDVSLRPMTMAMTINDDNGISSFLPGNEEPKWS
jgi:hypothetical protein